MVVNQACEAASSAGECTRMPLADQVEDLFRRAEPRLVHLARSQQIAPSAVEDIVQETLLEAWRSLDHLRDETRFSPWLDAICRNVCLRHHRRQSVLRAREVALGFPDDDAEASGSADEFPGLADPDDFDPLEELTRRDMALLLDRALGYLSPESRTLVERHYLAEIPQRELAAQMGLTLSALVSRLHRARGQILRALRRELRAEALAVGLAVTPEDALGWRETRMWCIFCGRQRMAGMFEPMPEGRVNLRLCCPACKPIEIDSLGIVDLSSARSFLPATKKVIGEAGRFVSAAMAVGGVCHCWICGRQSQLRIVRDASLTPQTWLLSSCGCLRMLASPVSLYGSLPAVRDFMFGPGRLVIAPDDDTAYAGRNAIRFCLLSPEDGRRLYVFADAGTLLPLAVVVE
jgi:RNA polymerase sigma factor (sigma-70 family)